MKDLKIPARGQIPTHLVYAAAIVGTPGVRSQDVQTFIDGIQRRLQELAVEHSTDNNALIMTRAFTDAEEDVQHMGTHVTQDTLQRRHV